MALFFNLSTLERESCNDPVKFIKLLEYHYKKITLPKRGSIIKPSKVPLTGPSFILNPDPIFDLKNVDIAYRVQYVKLAARRDYTLYKYYAVKSLDLSYFPDIDLDSISTNPWITVSKTQIHFKFEE